MNLEVWREKFPTRLDEVLKEKEITQKELAARMGINEPTMSRYANGLRVPKITTIHAMANVLEISIDDFVNFE